MPYLLCLLSLLPIIPNRYKAGEVTVKARAGSGWVQEETVNIYVDCECTLERMSEDWLRSGTIEAFENLSDVVQLELMKYRC